MIEVQPLTADQIRDFLTWQYEGPYAMYNMAAEEPQEALAFFTDPANGYFAIVQGEGELLGFCNFGADARVPGGSYGTEALDVGMGMRPALTGQGMGAKYASAVFAFAARQYPELPLRVTIAAFNKRAQRLCEKVGFRICDQFQRPQDGKAFVIMTRRPDEGEQT